MKFSEIKYQRPPVAELIVELDNLTQRLKTSANVHEAASIFWQYESVSIVYLTAQAVAYVHHTINTKDDFYNGENDFYDEQNPIIADKRTEFCRAMLNCPYRNELEKQLGCLLFEKMELEAKAMCSEILPLMQKENALASEYQNLYASALVDFNGKKCTISELTPFKQSPNRQTRYDAYAAEGKWFDESREKLDSIFQQLVENRTQQAKQMGYDSFVPLGYIRMQRIGYDESDIKRFREEIKTSIVPLVLKIKAHQKKELGLDSFKFWDATMYFKDGNANPAGTAEEILAAGLEMYSKLSPETAAFMQMMMDNELFDVLSREGKAPGGYCTTLYGHKMPFIFSNFNGTAADVDVLTHEAGHAFASYLAAKRDLPLALQDPGYESCEIHSMSMEFLTSDYHNLFFGENTEKYQFFHTADALTFLPYGTMVDEFQHIIYKNPTLTPLQRNEEWAKLEKLYRPWADFDDLPFYSRGANWQRQLHIFSSPFYYIDYCLAQSVALQFYAAFLQDKKATWKRYLSFASLAGTETYTGLVRSAGFEPPFEKGVLERVASTVAKKLNL